MTAMTRPAATTVRLRFTTGLGPMEVAAAAGTSLMEAARLAGVPGIVAECGGACVCATCHVLVAPDWMPVAGPPGATEAEMLEFVHGAGATSRLACQIRLEPEMDGLAVRVPESQG